jgi:CTP:molybdopterin cytidylyltransferase MocA
MPTGVAAIVLAAGESRRMGRAKALLDWGGKPLLQHQIDELTSAGCAPIVVVLGHEADRIAAAVRCDGGCRVVRNRDYASGRASSLRAGAEALPDNAAAVVVASVDTPVRGATVRALIEVWKGRPGPDAIIVPRHAGRNGHPSLFDGALLTELRAVREESQGLRAVRRAHADATTFLDIDDPLVTLNLNTPEAYDSVTTLQPEV